MSLLTLLLTSTPIIAKTITEPSFIESVLAFLIIPWVFYSVAFIFVIIMIACHENDYLGWSHTLFVVLMAYLCLKFNINYQDLMHNPLPILKWILIYLVIGVGWSFSKWFFYLKNILNEFNEKKNKLEIGFKTNFNYRKTAVNPDEQELYKKELINQNLYDNNNRHDIFKIKRESLSKKIEIQDLNSTKSKSTNQEFTEIYKYSIIPPQANDCKALITTWITHWPISLVWTLINDPIKKLINHLFESIKLVFQKISDRIFKSVGTEL